MMKLTEQQRRGIRMILLEQNTDCYFDEAKDTEYYAEKIVKIVEGN